MKQLDLEMIGHGGAREGAGRKPRSGATVPHARRPSFDGERHPVHVTLRMARNVWNLRSQRAFARVSKALHAEKQRGELRIVHYSVQGNHLHLIAEASDRLALARRMQGFGIRLAKLLNSMMGRRRGRVLAERYHVHVLRTRSEARNAVRYVLGNHVKHAAQVGKVGIAVDPFSSAQDDASHPVARAATWFLRVGTRDSP